MRNFKVVVMGGGTGSFVVLRGLKNYPVDLTAIINVTDSGGSTGRLRSEFGFLPVGDLRQCLAALARDDDETLIKLLTYRFKKGRGLSGHNLGNLILTSLRDIYGGEPKALEKAAEVFRISGRVFPVSLAQATLGVVYENGRRVYGEHSIDQPKFGGGLSIRQAFLKPKIRVYSRAARAIGEADLVVLGPGDLYTSTVPCLLVDGVGYALKKSKAKICYVINLVNRYSQTYGFTCSRYLEVLEQLVGRPFDAALVSTSRIPANIANAYRREKSEPPLDDLVESGSLTVVRADLAGKSVIKRVAGDELRRSFFRHDEDKLARALIKMLL
ncbi:MAG: YvcK family protein [Patescibacteria group bacterium]|nr:YvcK family protein [Patescibacteria group bacterium]